MWAAVCWRPTRINFSFLVYTPWADFRSNVQLLALTSDSIESSKRISFANKWMSKHERWVPKQTSVGNKNEWHFTLDIFVGEFRVSQEIIVGAWEVFVTMKLLRFSCYNSLTSFYILIKLFSHITAFMSSSSKRNFTSRAKCVDLKLSALADVNDDLSAIGFCGQTNFSKRTQLSAIRLTNLHAFCPLVCFLPNTKARRLKLSLDCIEIPFGSTVHSLSSRQRSN